MAAIFCIWKSLFIFCAVLADLFFFLSFSTTHFFFGCSHNDASIIRSGLKQTFVRASGLAVFALYSTTVEKNDLIFTTRVIRPLSSTQFLLFFFWIALSYKPSRKWVASLHPVQAPLNGDPLGLIQSNKENWQNVDKWLKAGKWGMPKKEEKTTIRNPCRS